MKLIDKPHCKKHEVYDQKCIGCRIKLSQLPKPKRGRPAKQHDTFVPPPSLGFSKREGYKNLFRVQQETVRINNKPFTYPVVTELTDYDPTPQLKTLLNRIYTDGADGNRRSLKQDVQTIIELMKGHGEL